MLFQIFARGLISFEYTNVANEDCVKFCMKEKNLGVEREWCNEMKNGQKLKLGDATTVSPQELSKKYKRQSLGMPKASPSSSIKSSGLSRHFDFIVSCTVVLFLERLSFHLVCLGCLVFLNKVVWTPVLAVLFTNKLLGGGKE